MLHRDNTHQGQERSQLVAADRGHGHEQGIQILSSVAPEPALIAQRFNGIEPGAEHAGRNDAGHAPTSREILTASANIPGEMLAGINTASMTRVNSVAAVFPITPPTRQIMEDSNRN